MLMACNNRNKIITYAITNTIIINKKKSIFLDGFLLSAGQSTAPPKNGPAQTCSCYSVASFTI
jgi:hypothetical protein